MLLCGIFLWNRQHCDSYILSKEVGKTEFTIGIFTYSSSSEILPIEGVKVHKPSTTWTENNPSDHRQEASKIKTSLLLIRSQTRNSQWHRIVLANTAGSWGCHSPWVGIRFSLWPPHNCFWTFHIVLDNSQLLLKLTYCFGKNTCKRPGFSCFTRREDSHIHVFLVEASILST